MSKTKTKAVCPISKYCTIHDFHHGGEAEELRKGIEDLLETVGHEEDWQDAYNYLERNLQKLLDDVNARDSLAFLEKDK